MSMSSDEDPFADLWAELEQPIAPKDQTVDIDRMLEVLSGTTDAHENEALVSQEVEQISQATSYLERARQLIDPESHPNLYASIQRALRSARLYEWESKMRSASPGARSAR